mgnify:FL=1
MTTIASELDVDFAEANVGPLLTVKEAASLARVHARTIRRWIAARVLPTVGARGSGSSRVLIRRKALAAFLSGLTA